MRSSRNSRPTASSRKPFAAPARPPRSPRPGNRSKTVIPNEGGLLRQANWAAPLRCGTPQFSRVRSLPPSEVACELGEVRDAEAGRRVVALAGVAGVEDVVVAAARLAERRDGTGVTRGERVQAGVPEPDPVPQVGLDDRR